jgi:hypothetical protein
MQRHKLKKDRTALVSKCSNSFIMPPPNDAWIIAIALRPDLRITIFHRKKIFYIFQQYVHNVGIKMYSLLCPKKCQNLIHIPGFSIHSIRAQRVKDIRNRRNPSANINLVPAQLLWITPASDGTLRTNMNTTTPKTANNFFIKRLFLNTVKK